MMNKGFTVVESLVAITILVLAVTGTTSAVQTGLNSHIYSKDQIVAFYLAQEGIEQIRSLRDENGLNSNNWLAGIAEDSSDPCYFGKYCIADIWSYTLSACPGGAGSCSALRQNSTNGSFGYDVSWPLSIYKREISLSAVSANEVSVLVSVTWSKGTSQREFRIRENIFNWQ